MSEVELKRRKLHGVLSSKSLLESLDTLILNKKQIEDFRNKQKFNKPAIIIKSPSIESSKSGISYSVVSKNPQHYFTLPENLLINREDIKSDMNFVPLTIKFSYDRPGNLSTIIELLSLPDDVRIIPIEFKVTESVVSDSTVAYLKFSSCVFDPIIQKIPLRNNSEISCSYEVEIIFGGGEGTSNNNNVDNRMVFKGAPTFSIPSKDAYFYELIFMPNAEEKYDAELRFNNVTEGIQTKYFLSGQGERRPPLGEIKLETRVGQMTQHEIIIPNKSNKKICFYVSLSDIFIMQLKL